MALPFCRKDFLFGMFKRLHEGVINGPSTITTFNFAFHTLSPYLNIT